MFSVSYIAISLYFKLIFDFLFLLFTLFPLLLLEFSFSFGFAFFSKIINYAVKNPWKMASIPLTTNSQQVKLDWKRGFKSLWYRNDLDSRLDSVDAKRINGLKKVESRDLNIKNHSMYVPSLLSKEYPRTSGSLQDFNNSNPAPYVISYTNIDKLQDKISDNSFSFEKVTKKLEKLEGFEEKRRMYVNKLINKTSKLSNYYEEVKELSDRLKSVPEVSLSSSRLKLKWECQEAIDSYYQSIKENASCLSSALGDNKIDYSKVDWKNPAEVQMVEDANKTLHNTIRKFPAPVKKLMFEHLKEVRSGL